MFLLEKLIVRGFYTAKKILLSLPVEGLYSIMFLTHEKLILKN